MNTYRSTTGKYQNLADQLSKRVPNEGESDEPKIELWRVSVNAYHDLYQNGMGNWSSRKDDFEKLCDVELPTKGDEALQEILEILPSGLDKIGCYECDGYGEYEEENEVGYEDDEGEIQYDYETEWETCNECDGTGEVDWEGGYSGVEDNEFEKLEVLFETLLDAVIEFILK